MNKKLLTIFLVFSFVMIGLTQERKTDPVSLEKISSQLYLIKGGRGAQGGAFIGETGVLLIDAKMNKESVEAVFAEIKKLTDKPLLYLVNTHSDGDHITGNQFMPETVTFVAHENCRKEFFHTNWDGKPSKWNSDELLPYVPSITFRDKMDIYLGSDKVELWYFGVGHTTGDAVIYFPEEKTAFIGDQIFLNRTQLIHSYKGGNSFNHVKTLQKMLDTLDAEKFCSGHSEIIDRDMVKNHMFEMKQLQDKVKSLIESKSLDEVKKEFDEDKGRLVESIYNELKNMQK